MRARSLVKALSIIAICITLFAGLPPAQAGTVGAANARLSAPMQLMAVAVAGDMTYLLGGSASGGNLRSIQRYDIASDTITTLSSQLPTYTSNAPAVWTGQYVYMFGGDRVDPGNVHYGALSEIVRFNPATGNVTRINATLPTPRSGASAFWTGQHAYVLGGSHNVATDLDRIYRFDPATETITTMNARLPTKRSGTAVAWDGTHAYIAGGTDGSSYFSEILRYSPATDNLTVLSATLPEGRAWAASGWDGQSLYLVGGASQTTAYMRSIARFTPSSGAATTVTEQLGAGRTQIASAYRAPYVYGFGGLASGYTDEILRYDTRNQAPVASFSVSVTNSFTVNVDASASNDPDGQIASYAWSWGDGAPTASGVTATHTYAGPGTYTVKLTVTDNSGAAANATHSATLNRQPLAAFSFTVQNYAVHVDGRNSSDPDGSALTYEWNWGDGTAAGSGAVANHTYASAGTRTVTLTVRDPHGGASQTTRSVTVPVVAPTARITFTAEYLKIHLNASTSTGTITSYDWKCPDGPQYGWHHLGRTTPSVTCTMSAPGTYPIRLRVNGPGGSAETVLNITVNAPPPPVARFTFAVTNLSVHLNASTSTPGPGGSIVSYAWKCPDGAIYGWHYIGSIYRTVTCTFGSSRTYPIRLRVEDSLGGSHETVLSVTVNAPPGPRASFTWTATPDMDRTVRLNASASSSPGATIRTYDWKCPDGPQYGWHYLGYTTPTVTCSFSSAGTYPVRLRVTDSSGRQAEIVNSVTVYAAQPPVARFTATPYATNFSVRLDASASTPAGSIRTYDWKCPDGPQYGWHYLGWTTPVVTCSFSFAGSYPIRLRVTDTAGRTGETVQYVNVGSSTVAASFTYGTSGATVTVDASATRGATTYEWIWGDGASQAGSAQASHAYTKSGTYTITLVASNAQGARSSYAATVTVERPAEVPVAEIAVKAEGLVVRASAAGSSDSDGSIKLYEWTWGDGSSVTRTINPLANHTYPSAGTYSIYLVVTDDDGYRGAASTTVSVVEPVIRVNGPSARISGLKSDGLQVFADAYGSTAGDSPIVSYGWTWGDLGFGQRPRLSGDSDYDTVGAVSSYTYSQPGTYRVTLTVTDARGLSDSTSEDVTVNPRRPNLPPSPALRVEEVNGITMRFDGSFSTDDDGKIVSHLWSFSDGSGLVEGAIVTHVWRSSGSHQVTLTVTDDQGASASSSQIVDVFGLNDVPPTPLPSPLPGFLAAVAALAGVAVAFRRTRP